MTNTRDIRVATIILNWNRREDTLACIESVAAMTYRSEVIVIDNGSTDGSVAAIHARHPDLTILRAGSNLGYAAGNNVGFDYIRRRTDIDAVLLLNNDTITEPDMLSFLVAEYVAMDGKAVIGPEVRYASAPETIWCAGGAIDWWRGYTKNIDIGLATTEAVHQPADVAFIVGCAMLLPVAAIKQIGGFDPRYFMYWEEVDWCVRAHAAGYRMRVVPAAVLYHKVSRSEEKPNPRVLYYLTRNRFLLLRAHLPWHQQLIALPWTLWGQLRTAFNLVRVRDWQRQRALLWGIRDAALGRTGASQIVW